MTEAKTIEKNPRQFDAVGMHLTTILNEKFRYGYNPAREQQGQHEDGMTNLNAKSGSDLSVSEDKKKFYPLFSQRNLYFLMTLCFEIAQFLYQLPNLLFSPYRVSYLSKLIKNKKWLLMLKRYSFVSDRFPISNQEVILIALTIFLSVLLTVAGAQAFIIIFTLEALFKISTLSFQLLFDMDDILSFSPNLTKNLMKIVQYVNRFYSYISFKTEIGGRDWNSSDAEIRWTNVRELLNNEADISMTKENLNKYLYHNSQNSSEQHEQGLSQSSIQHFESMDFAWVLLKSASKSKKNPELKLEEMVEQSSAQGSIYQHNAIEKTNSCDFDPISSKTIGQRNRLGSCPQSLSSPNFHDSSLAFTPKVQLEHIFPPVDLSSAASADRYFEGIEVLKHNTLDVNNATLSKNRLAIDSHQSEHDCDTSIEAFNSDPNFSKYSSPSRGLKRSSSFNSVDTESSARFSPDRKGRVSDWVNVGTRLGFLLLNSESVKKISKDGISNFKSPSFDDDLIASEVEENEVSSTSSNDKESSYRKQNKVSNVGPYPEKNLGDDSFRLESFSMMKNRPPAIPVHPMWTSPSSIGLNLSMSMSNTEIEEGEDNIVDRATLGRENSDMKSEIALVRQKTTHLAQTPVVSNKKNFHVRNFSLTSIITETSSRELQEEIIGNSSTSPPMDMKAIDIRKNSQEQFKTPKKFKFSANDIHSSNRSKKDQGVTLIEPPIEVRYLSPMFSAPMDMKKSSAKTPQNLTQAYPSINPQPAKRHPKLLPGCKMVVPIFSHVDLLYSSKRQTAGNPRYQMATVVSSRRIYLPTKSNVFKFSHSSKIQATNCLAVHLQLDKSFLKNGKFAEMHIRIPDDYRQMPRHSAYPIGSCVATSFGIGVVAGWRVEDDVYIIRSLWKNRGPGSACAYLCRSSIHGIIEAGVGFAVETTHGRGKVLAYVYGGSKQLKGKFFVLIKESSRLQGHAIELNRSQILSCPSARFVPVIEQIRAAAHYQIQLDSYNAALRQWDVDMMGSLEWSDEIEILFASFIKAVGEDPHFDSELEYLTASLISFLEDLDIGNGNNSKKDHKSKSISNRDPDLGGDKSHSRMRNIEEKGATLTKIEPPSTETSKTEPGLWFINDLFGGIFKANVEQDSDGKTNQSESNTANISGASTNKTAERDNYDRAYALIRIMKRALAIAQADAGSSRPNLRLALSIASEFLVFFRAVIKVRQINVSKEAADIRSRTLEEMKGTLYPIQKRMTKVGEGIMARLEHHGTKAKARLAHFFEILLKDETLIHALEHGEWNTFFSRIEGAIANAKILDAESCAQYHEKFQLIYNSLAPRATNSEAAAVRSGEKIAWVARFMKWMAEPRETVLKIMTRDDVLEILERIFVRVFRDNAQLAQMVNIYAFNFRSPRYFRMLINMQMSGNLWLPFLDAADEEISWAITRLPENTKEFAVPLAKIFSLGVASFRELRNAELAANWMNFLMEEPARSFIHDLDMKLVLSIEAFCNDVKQTMMILPYYASLDDDILNLLDEVDLDSVLNEMTVAILDRDKFSKYMMEKSEMAVDRFLHYLPKMSIPIERRDINDGWVITCRGKNGGDLTLSEVKIESKNLTCQVLGSANVFSSKECSSPPIPDDIPSIESKNSFESMESIEVSILDHVKELLLNAQRYGSWKAGRGGVDYHLSLPGTPLEGIPMSQVLCSAVELWQNLEIDDDELMEIVIRDISYQIQCQKERGTDNDMDVSDDHDISDDNTVNLSRNSKYVEEAPRIHKRFNPRVDPTVLFLDLADMTFNLNEFLFRIEPKERQTIFDPVFEGYGTLLIKNVSIVMRVECRKERIMKLGSEVTVPVLQLQQLDVSLDKVKFKFKDTGADWLLNKAVGGLSKNITEIVEVNLKEQIISQIHLALEHLNAFIEVNPELTLKVLGITIDDLEENIVWI